jgi:hypothetical protein
MTTPSTRSHQWEPEELEAINRARLMVSGRYRIPWGIGGEMMKALIDKGMIDQGGYLTETALRVRASTPPEGHNGE